MELAVSSLVDETRSPETGLLRCVRGAEEASVRPAPWDVCGQERTLPCSLRVCACEVLSDLLVVGEVLELNDPSRL